MTAADPTGADVEADVVLSDGSTVHVRPIRADDGDRLVRFHARLSPETQYLRFFSPHPVLLPREVERFTQVDYWDRFAIVAIRHDEIVGVARYDRAPGSDEAEVAFVIEDAQQGRGLGMLLLEHLAAAARRRAVVRFTAETLPMNSRMLQVFRDAGFTVTTRFADGVVRVEFPILPTEESVAAQERREHRAEARSVARILSPRSIAVVGASREPGTVGYEVFRNLVRHGFEGPVYPVNPAAAFVHSVKSFATVLDIPDPVDVAVLAVPAERVVEVVHQCGEKGVGGLVILSAGFSEASAGGEELQRSLASAARGRGMRVVGPNCIGVLNTDPDVSMNATFATVPPIPGHVGFLSQSGALGAALLHVAGQRGLGVSTFVSVGNKADVSGNDLLQYWEDDPRTSVILLYLESFGNPRKFSRIARRVGRRKPVVAVKSGRAGAADAAVDALFRQTGVIRVDTLREMVDVAQVLAHQPLPDGPWVAIIANSGGPGVMAADAVEGAGLEVARLSSATEEALCGVVGAPAGVTNPVDVGWAARHEQFRRGLELVLADEHVDAALAIYAPTGDATADEIAAAVVDAVRASPAKPVVACFLATDAIPAVLRPPEGSAEPWIPYFPAPESAVRALAHAARYGEWRRRPEGDVPDLAGVDAGRARALAGDVLAGEPAGRWLDEREAAELLAAVGIRVGDGVAGDGVETVVGVVQDPSFGPLVMFGMGGPGADLLADRAFRIVPVTDADAGDLIGSLRSSPLLLGYGDAPPADAAALRELVLRVGCLADLVPEVAELELSPVVVSPGGVSVTAARARLAPPPPPQPEVRRLRS